MPQAGNLGFRFARVPWMLAGVGFVLSLAPIAQARVDDTMTPHELIERGRYQEAAVVLTQMIADIPPGTAKESLAALYSNLGVVYDKLGRYLDAERTTGKSILLWKELGMLGTMNYARTVNNLGNALLNQHQYAKAEQWFQEALSIYRAQASPDPAGMALVISNVGLIKLCLHQYAEAERLLREAVQTEGQARKDTTNLASALNNLALACKAQNRLEDAGLYYSQAIEVWRKVGGGRHPEVGVGLHNVAMLELSLGQTARALEHFEEALHIIQETLPPDHPLRATVLQGYSGLLAKTGHKREAKQLSQLAQTLRTQHDRDNLTNFTVDMREFSRPAPDKYPQPY